MRRNIQQLAREASPEAAVKSGMQAALVFLQSSLPLFSLLMNVVVCLWGNTGRFSLTARKVRQKRIHEPESYKKNEKTFKALISNYCSP